MTTEQRRLGAKLLIALTQAIHEAGELGIGAGVLYTAVMQHCTLPAFESLIDQIVSTGLVAKSGHKLTWVGGAA